MTDSNDILWIQKMIFLAFLAEEKIVFVFHFVYVLRAFFAFSLHFFFGFQRLSVFVVQFLSFRSIKSMADRISQ